MEKRKSLILEGAPNTKRHRRQDTNSRYDRMMETMALSSIYPQEKQSRQRIDATLVPPKGSRISRVCYGPPGGYPGKGIPLKTTDASFSGWSEEEFCAPPDLGDKSSPAAYSSVGKASRVQEHLPEWLAQTFATLPRKHPLRCLLPVGYCDTGSSDTHFLSDSTPVETARQSSSGPDQLLSAFGGNEVSTSPTLVPSRLHRDFDVSDWDSTCSGHILGSPFARTGSAITPPKMRPFASPGPASTISRPPVPPQLTFDFLDINLRCSPQLPYDQDCTPDLCSPAFGLDVSPNDNHFTVDPVSISQDPLLETQPKVFLSAIADDPHIEGIALSELGTTPGSCYHVSTPPECFDSDSLPEPFGLNVGELDFHWTAFDRSELHQDCAARKYADSHSGNGEIDFLNGEPNWQYQGVKPSSPDDAGRFRFQAALDNSGT